MPWLMRRWLICAIAWPKTIIYLWLVSCLTPEFQFTIDWSAAWNQLSICLPVIDRLPGISCPVVYLWLVGCLESVVYLWLVGCLESVVYLWLVGCLESVVQLFTFDWSSAWNHLSSCLPLIGRPPGISCPVVYLRLVGCLEPIIHLFTCDWSAAWNL